MRLYVAGPMTHYPHFNYPAFIAAATLLRYRGYDVVSPAELDDPEDRAAALASRDGNPATYTGTSTWGDFLARDVKLLADDGIEGIVVLPGWKASRGARLETFVASALCGLPVFYYEAWGDDLLPVPLIELVRAWAAKDDISFHTPAPTYDLWADCPDGCCVVDYTEGLAHS
jgi:hypothetical protein